MTLLLFIFPRSGVLDGRTPRRKQDVCLHFSPSSSSPSRRGPAAARPLSSAPTRDAVIICTSHRTFPPATRHAAFNLGFSPNTGGYLHLTHLNRDAEDSRTSENKRNKGERSEFRGLFRKETESTEDGIAATDSRGSRDSGFSTVCFRDVSPPFLFSFPNNMVFPLYIL